MPRSNDSSTSGNKTDRIHDKFFKDIFRAEEYVVSLIRAGAPKPIVEIIEWSTLRLEPQAIQAGGHNEKFADLVFSAQLNDGAGEARVLLLFEHKSYEDSDLVRQMARYQFLMYLQNDFKPLIVPIVVFQLPSGKGDGVGFGDLFADVPERHLKELMKYSVNFRCLPIDVNQIDRQGLAGGTNIDAVIRAMSTVRKFDPAGLQDLLNRTGHVRAQERARIFKLVLGYVCDYNKDIKADVILDLQTKTSEERQMVLSAVETFREEGREEGLERGREEGREEGRVEVAANLLQEGMNSEKVVKVTSLSQERVETILHRMNGASKR